MTGGARRNVICKPVRGALVHCTWTCTCDPLCACSFVWHLSMFSQLKPGTCNFIRSSLASIFFLNGDFLLKIEGSLLCIQREKETFHSSTSPLFTPSRENRFWIPKQAVKPGIIHTWDTEDTCREHPSYLVCAPIWETSRCSNVSLVAHNKHPRSAPRSRWAVCLFVLHVPFIILRWRPAILFATGDSCPTHRPVRVRSEPKHSATLTVWPKAEVKGSAEGGKN